MMEVFADKSNAQFHNVQDACNENIISYEWRKRTKFLNSVYATIIMFQDDPENKKIVLAYAKSKVNNEFIFCKNYETFEAFHIDVMSQYHDLEPFDELKRKITTLSQSPYEDIFHYGLRARELKDTYKNELSFFFGEQGVPEEQLEKNEKFVTKFFIHGLIPLIRSFVTTEPTSLELAITIAAAGEASTNNICQPYRRRPNNHNKNVYLEEDSSSSIVNRAFDWKRTMFKNRRTPSAISYEQMKCNENYGESSQLQPKDFNAKEAAVPTNLCEACLRALKALEEEKN